MKPIKLLIIAGAIVVLAVAFQNCGKSDGGSDSPNNTASMTCAEAGVVGSWAGTVSGNPDVLTIASNCALASSYCTSSSTYTISSINVGCPPGASSCGTGTVRTSASNGNPNCFSPSSAANCSFSVFTNTGTPTLYYSCGGGVSTYTKQ